MSTYLGKVGSDSILHITSNTVPVDNLQGPPINTTVFHSNLNYLRVTDIIDLSLSAVYNPYAESYGLLPNASFLLTSSDITKMLNSFYVIQLTCTYQSDYGTLTRQYNSFSNTWRGKEGVVSGPFMYMFSGVASYVPGSDFVNGWSNGYGTPSQTSPYLHVGTSYVSVQDNGTFTPLPEWNPSLYGDKRTPNTSSNIEGKVYILNVAYNTQLTYLPISASGSVLCSPDEFLVGGLDISTYKYFSMCGNGTIAWLPAASSTSIDTFQYLGNSDSTPGFVSGRNDIVLLSDKADCFVELAPSKRIGKHSIYYTYPGSELLLPQSKFVLCEIIGTDDAYVSYEFNLEDGSIWKNTAGGKSYFVRSGYPYTGLVALDTDTTANTVPLYPSINYSYSVPDGIGDTYYWNTTESLVCGKQITSSSIVFYVVKDPTETIVARGAWFSSSMEEYTVYTEISYPGVFTQVILKPSLLSTIEAYIRTSGSFYSTSAPGPAVNFSGYIVELLAL